MYDVVMKPAGGLIAGGMTLDEAIVTARQWNRDNATADKFASCQWRKTSSSDPAPATDAAEAIDGPAEVIEPVRDQPVEPVASTTCSPSLADSEETADRDGLWGTVPEFVPTLDEIRHGCAEIQASWTLAERYRVLFSLSFGIPSGWNCKPPANRPGCRRSAVR